ncbi:hypothetical protein ANN_15185 [Periplaneta americana]|uniref:Uncharacterized protein n=1 Tax=Periplaneta americana TaxID=6978 RepID=A0ABQ8SFN7_PERAM|nr:hypothetical protein ANN_15185 [Periplaneta americana]
MEIHHWLSDKIQLKPDRVDTIQLNSRERCIYLKNDEKQLKDISAAEDLGETTEDAEMETDESMPRRKKKTESTNTDDTHATKHFKADLVSTNQPLRMMCVKSNRNKEHQAHISQIKANLRKTNNNILCSNHQKVSAG